MAASHNGQVVNSTISGTDLIVGIVVIETFKVVRVNGKGKHADLGIVKRRSIDAELHLIENVGREGVLQRQNIIGRFCFDLLAIIEITQRGLAKGVVPTRTDIKGGSIRKLVIQTN